LEKNPRTTTEDMEDWLGWLYRNPRTTTEDIEGQYTWGSEEVRAGEDA